jgi:hypothetical protein
MTEHEETEDYSGGALQIRRKLSHATVFITFLSCRVNSEFAVRAGRP